MFEAQHIHQEFTSVERNGQKYEAVEKYFTQEQAKVLEKRTIELIHTINDADVRLIVFMDRSARPLSWMLRAAWEKYANGNKLPKIKFVNIGREKGLTTDWELQPPRYQFDTEEEWQVAEKKFWSRLDFRKYIRKLKQDLRDVFKVRRGPKGFLSKGEIILVDDFVKSGFSSQLATNLFQRMFPSIRVNFYSFLKKDDEDVFVKEGWNGTYLPWNTEKAYTLLSDEDGNPETVTANPERDPKKREQAIGLRKAIKALFH